jgi:hypothetical protein
VTVLAALDREHAFHTTGRFELLASEHVPFVDMGAADVDGALRDAICADDGVVCVLGVSGAGKSSLIGGVTEQLAARYVPLRIPVATETNAVTSVGGFCRHALERFTELDLEPITSRHQRAIERALATERKTTRRRVFGIRAMLGGGTPVLNAKLGADFQLQAAEELKFAESDQAAALALQAALDVMRTATLVPVLIVEDTDHWVTTPEIASRFFDQVVRVLSKGIALDAVTVVAVQPVHQQSDGYAAVRELLTREVSIPPLPEPRSGLEVLLTSRIRHAVHSGDARQVFTAAALDLMAKSYLEDRSFRRTLSVARAALQQAVSDASAAIEAGHVQHGMAQYPAAA